MNKKTHRTCPGCLFVKRKVSGFFYFLCLVSAVGTVLVLLHCCAWAQPAKKDWLKQHGEWRLGVDPSWPPVEMTDDDGVYVGMGADYINLVARHLGVSVKVLPALTWVQVIDKAKKGEVDVLPAVAYTFDRSAYLNFSDVYLDIPLVIITRIDNRTIDAIDDLSGKIVSVVEGYPVSEWLGKDRPDIILHPYRNVSYALDAVAFGQAEAFVGDIASADYIIDRLNITSLKVAANTKYTYAMRFGVRKDWPELVPILNKALASISRKERDHIRDKWIKFKYKRDPWQIFKELMPFIIGVVALGLFGANWYLTRDLLYRKKKEAELRQIEERLSAIFETSPDGILIADAQAKQFTMCNQSLCRMLGYDKDEIYHLMIRDLHPADKLSFVLEKFERLSNGEIKSVSDIPVKRKDGSIFYADIRATGVMLGNKRFTVGFFSDITGRKKAADALHESEKKLLEAQQLAQLGYWKWDILTGNVEWSEEVFNIFHLDPKEFAPHIDSIMEMSPWPEDHERNKELIRRATESREKGTYEQRFLRPDKSVGYYYSTFQGRYDEKGALVSIIGTVMDITDRKKADESLRQSEEKFRGIVDNISIGVALISPDMAILSLNKKMKTWFPNVDLKERHICYRSFNNPPREEICSYCPTVKTLRDGLVHEDVTETPMDGQVFNYRIISSPVKDEAGTVIAAIEMVDDITERKHHEEALRESGIRFKGLFDTITSGVAIYEVRNDGNSARDYIVKDFNKAALAWEKKVKEEVVGKSLLDLRPRIDEFGIVPLLRQVWQTGVPAFFPAKIYADKQFSNWYENRIYRLSSGEVVAVFDDVTDRKKIEATLSESREYLNAVLNTIADPVFVKDRQHRFVLVNDAFCQFLGRSREEQIGKNDYDYFPKEQVDVFLQYDEKVFTTGQSSMNEEAITGGDGHVRTISTKKSLYKDKEGNLYVVGVIRDITYMKELEQKERLAQLGRLVADMAHEVSNPLMIISGNAQLSLMEDIGNDKVKENLDIIMRESNRAKEIIQRLLKFSRPSKGVRKEVDVNKLVEAVSGIIEHQFSLSNVTIKKNLTQGLSVVKVDEQQMHEVVMNLLNNAKDAMPGGGTIEISTSGDQNSIKIDVKDSGCGMREEIKAKIFEPFVTTKEKGTGLGLAICYSIIRAHNGELKVESQVGKGSIFSIILPGG